MAMTPVARLDDLITWTQPAFGLWIASAEAAHLGTIERTKDGYIAVSASGDVVGMYVSLTSAKHTFPRLAPRHPGLVLLIVAVVVGVAVMAFAITAFEIYLS